VHGVNGMDGMEAGVGSITWYGIQYTWVVKHADELYRTPILVVSLSVSSTSTYHLSTFNFQLSLSTFDSQLLLLLLLLATLLLLLLLV
jgi:hypothetical protein